MNNPQPGIANSGNTERPRTVTGAANVAILLILVFLIIRPLLLSVYNWRVYIVVHDYLSGKATDADLDAVDSDTLAALAATWVGYLTLFVAGVVFVVWLWRARINAELMGGAGAQRRTRGWVVGSWIAPAVNLWIPYQVVSDIYRSSAPQRPTSAAVIKAWWAFFVAASILGPIQARMASRTASQRDAMTNAYMSTLLTALELVAGGLIILIVRRITAWQNHRLAPHA